MSLKGVTEETVPATVEDEPELPDNEPVPVPLPDPDVDEENA